MQFILAAALLAVPALAELPKQIALGVPVVGDLPINQERDELWGANAEDRFWDINDPTRGECIDRKHAECLLSHYNEIWSGDFTQLPATISKNMRYYYNGTGSSGPGEPIATAANYKDYIVSSVISDVNEFAVTSFSTLYYFIGCQSIAQRWMLRGKTTGTGVVNGIQLPKGAELEFKGTDIMRVTKEMYKPPGDEGPGVEMWMILEAVTSEDDQNAQMQLEQIAARRTAMGSGGGKSKKRAVRSAKMPLLAEE